MNFRPGLVVVAACIAGLAGCTANHDLPTISGNPSASSALEIAAKKYDDCMSDAGIEVTLTQNDKGQLVVVQFTGDHEYVWNGPGGSGLQLGPADSQALRPETEQFLRDIDDFGGAVATLWVDRVDRSETYAQCLDESGYSTRAAWGSGQIDPAPFQKQVDANNKWAACARENGWPNVQDSVMPTDLNNPDWPTILLPESITEDQLRALLDACPNLNPEHKQMLEDWYASHDPSTNPDIYIPDPQIGFSSDSGSSGTTPDDHTARLNTILYETYIELTQQVTPASGPTPR